MFLFVEQFQEFSVTFIILTCQTKVLQSNRSFDEVSGVAQTTFKLFQEEPFWLKTWKVSLTPKRCSQTKSNELGVVSEIKLGSSIWSFKELSQRISLWKLLTRVVFTSSSLLAIWNSVFSISETFVVVGNTDALSSAARTLDKLSHC